MLRRKMRLFTRFSLLLVLCFLVVGAPTVMAFPAAFMSGSVTIDGTETLTGSSRMYRDGIPSTLASPKIFPGEFTGSATYYYKVISVLPASEIDYDVSVRFEPSSTDIFCAAYTESFDPNDMATHYLADAGASSLQDFSFTVPSGKELLLVFMNVTSILPASCDYRVTLLTDPTFSVEVETVDHGTGQTDKASAESGETITLTASPEDHYRFVEWEVVSPDTLVITNNTFSMPMGPVVVRPVFEQIPQVLQSITLTPPEKTAYAEGDKLSLTGLAVSANYDYGSAKTITNYSVSLASGTVLIPEHREVVVTYEEGGVTKSASFVITVSPLPIAQPNPPTGDTSSRIAFALFGCTFGILSLTLLKKKTSKTPSV